MSKNHLKPSKITKNHQKTVKNVEIPSKTSKNRQNCRKTIKKHKKTVKNVEKPSKNI